ncbi:Ubiquinone biosynthesis O-methyltransferase [Planctomycetes bacterium CA13]|uniref:Ubiquinone biosynthesis O-methyltransferase n=2 Tax=Novipirellula herctigrandis TaxID=2527986 RepID=A0A5C5Z2I7_9BACT|nr:Ubiquinone biosynthesis O-methyltransferase [Planctomycetes bacterium CA13]
MSSEEQTSRIESQVAEFWDRESSSWGDKYGVKSSYFFRCQTIHKFFTEVADEGSRVLDYGCGAGDITFPLLQLGHQVVGVDIAEKMVEKSALRARQSGFEDTSEYLHINDDTMKHLRNREFDFVVCSSVIEYVLDDSALLDFFYSILRPGGRLIISVPDVKSLFCQLDRFLHRHSDFFGRIIPVEKLAYLDIQQRQYKIGNFVSQLSELGFEREKRKYNSITKQRGILMEKISNVPGLGMLCIMRFKKRS